MSHASIPHLRDTDERDERIALLERTIADLVARNMALEAENLRFKAAAPVLVQPNILDGLPMIPQIPAGPAYQPKQWDLQPAYPLQPMVLPQTPVYPGYPGYYPATCDTTPGVLSD